MGSAGVAPATAVSAGFAGTSGAGSAEGEQLEMRSPANARPHTILTGTLEKWLKRETPLPTPAHPSGDRSAAAQQARTCLTNVAAIGCLRPVPARSGRMDRNRQDQKLEHVVRWEGKQGPFFMTLRQTKGRFVAPAPCCCRRSVVNDPAAGSPKIQSLHGAFARPEATGQPEKERERRKDRQGLRRSQPGRFRTERSPPECSRHADAAGPGCPATEGSAPQ